MDLRTAPPASGAKDLISVLAQMGQLTADQVAKARVELASSDKKQLEIVAGLGVTDEEVLAKAQAAVLSLPYFDQPSFVLLPKLSKSRKLLKLLRKYWDPPSKIGPATSTSSHWRM